MTNVKMIALRNHPFGTGVREAGEEYEATQDDSKILVGLKWAELAGGKSAPKTKPAPTPKAADKPAKKQSYRTRDLKAKG